MGNACHVLTYATRLASTACGDRCYLHLWATYTEARTYHSLPLYGGDPKMKHCGVTNHVTPSISKVSVASRTYAKTRSNPIWKYQSRKNWTTSRDTPYRSGRHATAVYRLRARARADKATGPCATRSLPLAAGSSAGDDAARRHLATAYAQHAYVTHRGN